MSEASSPGPEWALDWRALEPDQRARWWEQLWTAAIELNDRYRLGLRSGWWRDDIQVQTLAAFATWVRSYDSGAWTDPTGKLQLLYDLDRVRALLRGGERLFEPDRELADFTCEICVDFEPAD
jgi:hypothetical protein